MGGLVRGLAAAGLVAVAAASAAGAGYPWQQPQATVLPTGNLAWAPHPFVFEKGASVRYIDYAGGNDAADGTTPATAWQHHPWDANATAMAKACTGIQTYVFKRGVAYRGALVATESGAPGNPIRLTSDPNWGTGAAEMLGSTQIDGGWHRATAADAPGIPDATKVWYVDLGVNYDPDGNTLGKSFTAKFSALWQVKGDDVERLHIARTPNYDLSDPNYPVKNWFVWTHFVPAERNGRKSITSGTFTSPALKDLGDRHLLDGAAIWTETAFLMSPMHKVAPKDYDPQAGTVAFADSGGANYTYTNGPARVHFMLENAAPFLDAPGEYFFATSGPHAGRLYLRPPGDIDPNTARYEVAQTRFLVQISDQHDIVISGLGFRYNDPDDGTYGFYPYQVAVSPCVRVIGNCRNIMVKNNTFADVADVLAAFPRPGGRNPEDGRFERDIGPFANDVMDNIVFSDNDVKHVERAGAVYMCGAGSRDPDAPHGQLLHVDVLRNRIFDAGFRADMGPTSSIPAICVDSCQTCEIAGNIVERSYGNGIFTHGGKHSGFRNDVPLTRMLVHDNQLDTTMLGCNDYGGLEHFQGGPIYIYNNITRNCIGDGFLGHELGYSLYLDGGFKVYSFNNIIAGRVEPGDPNYYNNCGYFMVFGFMDQCFNNTIYNFQYALDGSSGNRSNILGNLMVDSSKSFVRQNRAGDVSMMGGGDTGQMGRVGIPTMAYADNVFYGTPAGSGGGKHDAFGEIGGTAVGGRTPTYGGDTLGELSAILKQQDCRLSSIGVMADEMPLVDPAQHDYRLRPGTVAAGHGVKYFVPWALARTVGEWNFYQSATSPQVVLGENFYMSPEYVNRDMYYFLPRNDLTVSQCKASDYVAGDLEDWIPGALSFDGTRTAAISQAELTRNVTYRSRDGSEHTLDGTQRQTVDMGTNDFLIETVFSTQPGQTRGTIASKMSAAAGYALEVDEAGAIALVVKADGGTRRFAGGSVNDGHWHHVLAEVDRGAGHVRLYVDGKLALDSADLALGKTASLANDADFVVGRGLVGAVDFLRVCRSTLAESKTTIGELYAWEFDGPFLRDFLGNKPTGRREAGAMGSAR